LLGSLNVDHVAPPTLGVRLNIKNSPAVSLNCYCICWALKLAQVVRGKPVHHCVVCLLIPFSC